MQTEREREAADLRANGQQQAQTIRARAEREATVILAEANRQSEELRGQGDAEKNRILAEAFGRDPDFFAFLPLDAGLRDRPEARRHAHGAEPDLGVLPLLQRPQRRSGSGLAPLRTTPGAAPRAACASRRLPCQHNDRCSTSSQPSASLLRSRGFCLRPFPDGVRRAMYEAAHTPSDRMRLVGIVSAVLGVVIVWWRASACVKRRQSALLRRNRRLNDDPPMPTDLPVSPMYEANCIDGQHNERRGSSCEAVSSGPTLAAASLGRRPRPCGLAVARAGRRPARRPNPSPTSPSRSWARSSTSPPRHGRGAQPHAAAAAAGDALRGPLRGVLQPPRPGRRRQRRQ